MHADPELGGDAADGEEDAVLARLEVRDRARDARGVGDDHAGLAIRLDHVDALDVELVERQLAARGGRGVGFVGLSQRRRGDDQGDRGQPEDQQLVA